MRARTSDTGLLPPPSFSRRACTSPSASSSSAADGMARRTQRPCSTSWALPCESRRRTGRRWWGRRRESCGLWGWCGGRMAGQQGRQVLCAELPGLSRRPADTLGFLWCQPADVAAAAAAGCQQQPRLPRGSRQYSSYYTYTYHIHQFYLM